MITLCMLVSYVCFTFRCNSSFPITRFVWIVYSFVKRCDFPCFAELNSMLILFQGYFEAASKTWDERKLSRVLTERARSQSIASSVLWYPSLSATSLMELFRFPERVGLYPVFI